MHGPGYERDPQHRISVTASSDTWVAERDGVELARSDTALALDEAGYPPVIYFPRQSVHSSRLSASATKTYCPFKGQASYFAIDGNDVAWTYVTPYTEVDSIERYVAFYPTHVTVRRVD